MNHPAADGSSLSKNGFSSRTASNRIHFHPSVRFLMIISLNDVPTGTALVMFMQTFGGALFVSVAQNVFNNRLISELVLEAPGVDTTLVLHTGATSLKDFVDPAQLPGVQSAYNTALTETWYAAVAMSCLSIFAWGIEWRSVKGMKPGAGGMA